VSYFDATIECLSRELFDDLINVKRPLSEFVNRSAENAGRIMDIPERHGLPGR
jgi:hypothetical protein